MEFRASDTSVGFIRFCRNKIASGMVCILHLSIPDLFFFFFLLQFPYCDGCHNNHNKATGDNVGPLIIVGKKKDPEKTEDPGKKEKPNKKED